VETATKNLQFHNIRTEIVPVQVKDATTEWAKIVNIARECTVIFNTIDRGDYWDFAVASLAIKFNLIYCDGGTEPYYGHQGSAVFCKPGGKPCWSCFNDLSNQEVLKKLTPDIIDTLSSIEFLPVDEQYRMGGSNVYTCCGTSHLITSLVAQYLIGRDVPNRLILYYGTYELEKFKLDPNPNCLLCTYKNKENKETTIESNTTNENKEKKTKESNTTNENKDKEKN